MLTALDNLRQNLLYNNVIDVWVALCDERNWKWFDVTSYNEFLIFLDKHGLDVKRVAVCPTEPGMKTQLAEESSEILGETAQVSTLRLDEKTISKIRSYRKI